MSEKKILNETKNHNPPPPPPPPFKLNGRSLSQVSSRITRQSVNNLLFVPKAKTEYYRRSVVISSCNLWNNMSNEMRESTSLEIFKTKYLDDYFN